MIGLLWLLACNPFGGDEPGHDEHDEHGDEHAPAVVTLAPEALAAAALGIAPAEERALRATLSVPGHIRLDPTKEAQVGARTSGQLDAIHVRTGDRVAKGQVLATVQSLELGEAVAAWHGAEARADSAAARKRRLVQLEAEGVSSEAQVLDAEAELAVASGDLEAAEERLRILGVDPTGIDPSKGEHFPSHFPIRAPIAGELLATSASVGQAVDPGTALFHLGDLDTVWVMLDLYERDLSRVAVGQDVAFGVDAFPGETFHGTVEQVGSLVQPEARTVEIRVVVPNPDHRLKPNMYARADLDVGSASGASGVVVPAEAVQEIEGKKVVFVAEGGGTFRPVEVSVAEEAGDEVRLGAGLVAGQPVVVKGAFTLKSELTKGELGEGHAH
jgi:cobalt-zinc-cadmium efflux system membrane fusion protein